MPKIAQHPNKEGLQENLEQVNNLLHKHRLIESLVHKQAMPRHALVESLVHKQNLAELQARLDQLHPADVAYILESLPIDDRLLVWDMVKAERDGEILLEVSDSVRETLIANMDSKELLAAAETLDTDEIADLAPDLPRDVLQELLVSLGTQNRARLQSAMSYPENTVGALMDFDFVTIREDISLEVVLRYLRRLGDLPGHTDKLFVVSRDNTLQGVLPFKRLLIHNPDVTVAAVMADDAVTFHPDGSAADAAQAFERYNLVSAPVVTKDKKLLGRITVDVVMDFIREKSESERLNFAGLREEEDLFASVWTRVRNRLPWLAVNLCTAFLASRVIGVFEGTIVKIIALATLMPIVAGMSGNSSYQTATLVIRGLALKQINWSNLRTMVIKEIGVGVTNGLLLGGVIGFVAYLLYHSVALGLVMASAMLLNFLVAALAGIFIPMIVHRLGRDPALAAGVLLTATTDNMGFFIFLGLASIFLV